MSAGVAVLAVVCTNEDHGGAVLVGRWARDGRRWLALDLPGVELHYVRRDGDVILDGLRGRWLLNAQTGVREHVEAAASLPADESPVRVRERLECPARCGLNLTRRRGELWQAFNQLADFYDGQDDTPEQLLVPLSRLVAIASRM